MAERADSDTFTPVKRHLGRLFLPMPRAAPAEARQRSQRASSEVRNLESEKAETQRKLETEKREKQEALRRRNCADKAAGDAQQELASIDATLNDVSSHEINTKRTLCRRVLDVVAELERHHTNDIVKLALAACKRICKKRKAKLGPLIQKVVGKPEWKLARDAVRDFHDKRIFDHLRANVYTPEHFALLRLVVGLSKRNCSIIQQAPRRSRCVNNGARARRSSPSRRRGAVLDVSCVTRGRAAPPREAALCAGAGRTRRARSAHPVRCAFLSIP